MSDTVGVVVITFNRLEFLKEIISALNKQTRKIDEIFVINNSSTDGTEVWLAEQPGLTVIKQPNVGSSGGQYTGFKAAFEKGHDWIWTMDDDVVPEPDCLERLLEGYDRNTVRTPLRFQPDGKPFFNDTIRYNLTHPFHSFWRWGIITPRDLENKYIPAVGITFEGPLIPRDVVAKTGFPDKNFFIFGDDTEYFIRAARAGAEIVIYRDARMHRKLNYVEAGKNFTWKHYYAIRNILAIDVLHGNLPVRLIRPLEITLKWLLKCRNLNEVKITLKAFRDGYFYKSGN